jgi:hypothetical protein
MGKTEKTVAKPKQTGMALEVDVMKKIAHQLERLPPDAGVRIVRFVQDWAHSREVKDIQRGSMDGQLPLPTEFPV